MCIKKLSNALRFICESRHAAILQKPFCDILPIKSLILQTSMEEEFLLTKNVKGLIEQKV